ncbi:unnamed protein product [Linum tenue]|uniref:Uncharacterized protein n=1 Tax=Linum tenue TaxID=586396 RepID=A0AAV0M429_9ROSI|nr:unnamed protein product [Linum tenue]
MWDSESETGGGGGGGRDYGNGAISSTKHALQTDGFELRDRSWYVATDIPSDFLVQIEGVQFHLHKYPLLSRSGKMNRLIYESREAAEVNKVVLDDLPGGPDAFELAAKFCYGIAVDLTASNISGLRCAAEYMEMTEDLEEGNLIFKTEAFLSYVVLSSWRDSIVVLKNCEKLSPWAENLQIVRRCSESIAWKACANPKGIRWAYTGKVPPKVSSPKWTDSSSSPSRNQQPVPPDWWFEDVSILRTDHFVRVITAIKVKGMRFELIGAAIMHYATKWLPGMIKDGGGIHETQAHPTLSEHERKRLCRVMDCQKLSIDACMHAAQNERLPLRIVVQVLFSEQVKISNAIAHNNHSSLKETGDSAAAAGFYQPMVPNRKTLLEGTPQSFQEGWSAAKKDINTLKFELETVKAKYMELQGELESLQRQFEKATAAAGGKKHGSSAWAVGWRKLSMFGKGGGLDGSDHGGDHHHRGAGEGQGSSRKTPARRWRNSIS